MSDPDFEALRRERNESMRKRIEKTAQEYGVPADSLRTSFNPNACYCACATGGPCEHKWDGEWFEFDGGGTATCSRCGGTAMSHSMRVGP